MFTWRRDARRAGGEGGVTFTPVVVDPAAVGGRADDGGVIEVEFGSARLRISRGADVGMTMAVIGALRGRR